MTGQDGRPVVASGPAGPVELVERGADVETAEVETVAECLRLTNLVAEFRRREASASRLITGWVARAEAAGAKIRAVERLHVWTNEDGRRFVFADDLAAALQIPDAALAAPPPSEGGR